jgi:hypothetical protein
MPDDERDETDADLSSKHVRLHYVKSAAFHSMHADGVFGGLTPNGLIHVAFFAERFPIPTQIDIGLGDDGKPGEISGSRVARDGILRELQADVFMTRAAAVALHEWLGRHLTQLDALAEARAAKAATD